MDVGDTAVVEMARASGRELVAVDTAWQWRRSDVDSTQSVRRVQASSRESLTDMVVTLAERPLSATPRTRPALMEKFVIEGGRPLEGTVVPAGNRRLELRLR